MGNAVLYAYTTTMEERPTLVDQFAYCRDYATAHGYTILSEFNDIDTPDHEVTGAAMEAIRNTVASHESTVVLVYQPSAAMLDQLNNLGAKIEAVPVPHETH